MRNENANIPYFKKENIKKNNQNINNINDNYFLKEENIQFLVNKRNNNYQDQYLIRQIYDNSKEKKHDNKNNEDKEKATIKETNKNYYSNNNSFINTNENNLTENSYISNFEKIKKMNNNIKNILSNMKNSIQPINKEKIKIKKSNINEYIVPPIEISYTNKTPKSERKNKDEKFEEDNSIKDFKYKENKNKFTICDNEKLIIDGIKIKNKNKNDLSKIGVNTLNVEQEKKIIDLYKNKDESINIKNIINDLYEYKLSNQNLTKIIDEQKEVNTTIINEKLLNSKKDNNALNIKKNFLINEITKSIYNNEKLKQRYKNEIERINSFINKIKFDLENNKPLNKDL